MKNNSFFGRTRTSSPFSLLALSLPHLPRSPLGSSWLPKPLAPTSRLCWQRRLAGASSLSLASPLCRSSCRRLCFFLRLQLAQLGRFVVSYSRPTSGPVPSRPRLRVNVAASAPAFAPAALAPTASNFISMSPCFSRRFCRSVHP